MGQIQSDDYFVGAGSQQQDPMDVEGQRRKLQGKSKTHSRGLGSIHRASPADLADEPAVSSRYVFALLKSLGGCKWTQGL